MRANARRSLTCTFPHNLQAAHLCSLMREAQNSSTVRDYSCCGDELLVFLLYCRIDLIIQAQYFC